MKTRDISMEFYFGIGLGITKVESEIIIILPFVILVIGPK